MNTKIIFHQKAIILNADKKFLALKASYKGKLWDLPGGQVEIPEEHDTALIREVREEAGIEIKNIQPLMVNSGYDETDDSYFLFIGYKCEAATNKVILSDEHTELKWVTADEFLALQTPDYLKDFIAMQLQ